MRILAIRGQNLASLAKEFTVDLTASPLSGTGLFAITGETGAGKSTILDALSLALYGEHPRGAISGSERQPDPSGAAIGAKDSRSLLRRGAGSGYAEADFVGRDGLQYRARWSVNRARGKADGKLQNEERQLLALPGGEPVAAGIRPVLEAVERLTDLTFAQFRRTVLLAQGEFDAFLMADEGERALLLEKLTGTDVYARVSARVYARHAAADRAHEALVAKRESIGLLDDARRMELTTERAALAARAEAVAALAEALAASRKATKQQAELAAKLPDASVLVERAAATRAGAEEADSAARDRIAALQPLWDEAARQDAALAIMREAEKAAVEAVERIARQKADMAGAVQSLTGTLTDLRLRRDAVEAALAARPGDLRLAQRRKDIADLIGKRAEFRHSLARVEAAIRRAEADRSAADLSVRKTDEATEHLKTRIEQASSEADALERQVEAAGLPALRMRESAVQGQIALARDAWRVAVSHARAVQEGLAARGIAEAADLAAEKARAARDAAAAERTVAEAAVAASSRVLDLAEAAVSAAAESLRSHLEPGVPCPVCGATSHPHASAAHGLGEAAAALRAERANRRQTITDASMREREATRQLATAEADGKAALGRIGTAEAEAAKAAADYAALLPGLAEAAPPAAPDGDAPDQLKALGLRLDREQNVLADTIKAATQLADRLAELRRNEAAMGRDMQAAGDQRRQAETALAAARERLASLAAEGIGLAERLDSTARELADDLPALDLSVAQIDIDASAALRRLERLADEHDKRIRERDDLVRLIGEGDAKLIHASADAEQAEKRDSEAQAALAAASEALAVARASRATVLDGEPTETHRARHLGEARIAGLAFADAKVAEAKAQAALQGLKEALALAEATARDTADAVTTSGETLRALAPDAAALTDAAHLSALASAAQQDIGGIDQRLRDDEAARRVAADLSAEIALSEQALAVLAEVNSAVGSSDGKRFRTFAQGVTLDHLVALANEQLTALAPRYRLARGETGDLAIHVVDRDMADERRSARSLSGGERFLVSLALALALSGLEGRRAFVDTLFIDEGFGSLDAETLDMAVDALEALQGRGRKVGVITHVAAMIDRIAVQVRVEKRGGGRSEVRVVGC